MTITRFCVVLFMTACIHAQHFSPACTTTSRTLDWDWDNIKSSASITLTLRTNHGNISLPIQKGSSSVLENVLTFTENRAANGQSAYDNIVNAKDYDRTAKDNYAACHAELGKDGFFDLVVRSLVGPPDWARVDENLEWQVDNNRSSLEDALHNWHQGDKVRAMAFLLSGQQHSTGVMRIYRQAFHTDASRLFKSIEDRLQNCNWSGLKVHLEWQRDANFFSMQDALYAWHHIDDKRQAIDRLKAGQSHSPGVMQHYERCFATSGPKLFAMVDDLI